MTKDLKANLLYLIYDHRFSLTVFWSILLASTALIFIISLIFSNSDIGMSLSVAMYIFCGITGFVMTKETFPFLIKLGSTRNNYIFSVIIFNISLALFMVGVFAIVLQLVEILNSVSNTNNFKVFSTLEGTTLTTTLFNELWFNAMICFLLLAMGFLFGAIFYRFGLIGGFIGLILTALIVILPGTRTLVGDLLINNIVGYKLDLNYLAIIVLATSAFIPSWLLLRTASTTASATR